MVDHITTKDGHGYDLHDPESTIRYMIEQHMRGVGSHYLGAAYDALYAFASVKLERDAAIARADGMEGAGAEQAKRADENYTALIAARAAHAEAMALLREIAKLDSGNIYSTVPHGDMSRVKNYIAKYDKTERHEPFPDYLKGA